MQYTTLQSLKCNAQQPYKVWSQSAPWWRCAHALTPHHAHPQSSWRWCGYEAPHTGRAPCSCVPPAPSTPWHSGTSAAQPSPGQTGMASANNKMDEIRLAWNSINNVHIFFAIQSLQGHLQQLQETEHNLGLFYGHTLAKDSWMKVAKR